MSHDGFRPFSKKQITKAIERHSECSRALRVNATTVQKIGQALSGLRDSTIERHECIRITVTQTLQPSSSRNADPTPHPKLIDAYIAVVNDILDVRRRGFVQARTGQYAGSRPSIQMSSIGSVA